MVPKIKHYNKQLQLAVGPREKLLAKGRKHLSDVELLAILLGTGCAKNNVLTLSDSLLKEIPLTKLSSVAIKELTTFPGVGRLKAMRILAALELGERLYAPASLTKVVINGTRDIVSELREYATKKQEHLVVLYLNARREVLQKELIGIGSLTSLVITPKEILSPALQLPCSALVVAHNHPSGDPYPSDDDIQFTKRIQQAGELMGIHLLDHIILARTSYYSFGENKVGR